jgi:hypothetical protein
MKKVILLAILLGTFMFFSCGKDDIPVVNDDVSVYVYPDSMSTVYYEDSLQFRVSVFNTTDTTVDWYVDNILEGNSHYGTINSTGLYIAPDVATDFDRIVVKAVSHADSTKADSASVLILDRYQVYVDSATGDDINGTGSLANKFRTISRALATAISGQTILVGLGTYNAATDEIFPISPTYNVYVQGRGIDSTFVDPPTTAAAFKLEYEHVAVKSLTVRGSDHSGTGIEFHGGTGTKLLKLEDVAIENFHNAAIKTGEADTIRFISNQVSNCVNGVVIEQPTEKLILNQSTFTDIDSIAIQLISPVNYQIDFYDVTIDGAFIGLNLTEGSFAIVQESDFSNIDSVAILLFDSADLGNSQVVRGNNDFRGCTSLCVYNNTSGAISAYGNWWPASDSATIDTQYIYDDDEDSNLGPVHFIPFNQ